MAPATHPPPRSSAPTPATPLTAVLPTAPLSRPGTPLGGRPGKPAPTLSLPALLNDIGLILASGDGWLDGNEFKPDPPVPGAGEALDRLRKGELGKDDLDGDTAVRLAEEWTGDMDRLLARVAEEERDVAAKGDSGKEDRVERVQAWAADVGRGLVAA
ncbi:hypothetical protein JCM10295v2_006312 [Rhodotorula toruloides]